MNRPALIVLIFISRMNIPMQTFSTFFCLRRYFFFCTPFPILWLAWLLGVNVNVTPYKTSLSCLLRLDRLLHRRGQGNQRVWIKNPLSFQFAPQNFLRLGFLHVALRTLFSSSWMISFVTQLATQCSWSLQYSGNAQQELIQEPDLWRFCSGNERFITRPQMITHVVRGPVCLHVLFRVLKG